MRLSPGPALSTVLTFTYYILATISTSSAVSAHPLPSAHHRRHRDIALKRQELEGAQEVTTVTETVRPDGLVVVETCVIRLIPFVSDTGEDLVRAERQCSSTVKPDDATSTSASISVTPTSSDSASLALTPATSRIPGISISATTSSLALATTSSLASAPTASLSATLSASSSLSSSLSTSSTSPSVSSSSFFTLNPSGSLSLSISTASSSPLPSITTTPLFSSASLTQASSTVPTSLATVSSNGVTSTQTLPSSMATTADVSSTTISSVTPTTTETAVSVIGVTTTSPASATSPTSSAISPSSSLAPPSSSDIPTTLASVVPTSSSSIVDLSSTTTHSEHVSGSMTAMQAGSTESGTVLPGTKLEVKPIGLGVFAGLAFIVIVIVAIITFERMKHRRNFRDRRAVQTERFARIMSERGAAEAQPRSREDRSFAPN